MARNDNKTNLLSDDSQISRRQVLAGMAAGATMAFPTIVPARALGRDGAVAPSEKINLGVIGIGPRCTYDLTSMPDLSTQRVRGR